MCLCYNVEPPFYPILFLLHKCMHTPEMFIPIFSVDVYTVHANIYLCFNLLPLIFCALLHLRRNITWQKLGSKEFIMSVASLE